MPMKGDTSVPVPTSASDLQSQIANAGGPTSTGSSQATATPAGAPKSNLQTAYHLTDQQVAMMIPWTVNTFTPGHAGEGPDWGANDALMRRSYVPATGAPGQTVPMLDALQGFYALDPTSRSYIQSALINRGFLSSKWQQFGDDDEKSFKAWQTALNRAAGSGKTIWQVLGGDKVTSQETFFASGGDQYNSAVQKVSAAYASRRQARAPLQVRYSNPEDLKAVARSAALNTIGYVPDDKWLDQFVSTYHGLEAKPQKEAYAGKRNVTEAPHAEVSAADKLREKFSTESSGFGAVKAFQQMLGILGVNQ